MYGELVYRLGKRYGAELRANPDVEYPYFAGALTDLVDADTADDLSGLQGEYTIAYNASGVRHSIRVYYEQGTFEAEGTPPTRDSVNLSSDSDVEQGV